MELFIRLQTIGILEEFVNGSLKKKDEKMDDAIDIEMQCDLLVITAIICQPDIHRKVFSAISCYQVIFLIYYVER